jgi:tetratricopeptide (TPR) repeat protein
VRQSEFALAICRRVAVVVALLFVREAAAQGGVAPSPEEIRDLIKAGRYADAETAARAHLAVTEAATGCESLETAEAMDLLVDSLWRGGKAKSGRAAELAEEALAIKVKAVGERDRRVSDSLVDGANAWETIGNRSRARALLERALGISTDLWGPDDRRVALIHNNLGSVLYELEPPESERHMREALRIYEAVDGPESDEVADVLNNLANLAANRGDLAEAEEGYRRVIRIHEQALGARHPTVGSDYSNLGYLHTETGDYEEARSELEHALSILQEALGREHPCTPLLTPA